MIEEITQYFMALQVLTHLPLVLHIYASELGELSNYLNQCWDIVNKNHKNKVQ